MASFKMADEIFQLHQVKQETIAKENLLYKLQMKMLQ